MKPLLAGLDDVDWSKLHHAYGPAVDVPRLLRALVDPVHAAREIVVAAGAERSVREQVIWELWGNVFHQGTRWHASPRVVPFLVEILERGDRDDAELMSFLLTYLEGLALGYAGFPDVIDPDAYFKEAELVVDPAPDDDRGYAVWARDCFLGVERAVASAATLITHTDRATALAAVSLVSHFKRRAHESTPALLAAARSGEAWRAGNAMIAHAMIAGASLLPEIEEALASSDTQLRLYAAVAYAVASPADVTDAAVHTLVTTPPSGLSTCWCDRSMSAVVSRALELLPERHHERAVEAISTQMVAVPAMARLDMVATLLRIALPDGPPALARDLQVAQRRALEAIRDHAPWVVAGGTFGNMSSLARAAGIGGSRDELEGYLVGSPLPRRTVTIG